MERQAIQSFTKDFLILKPNNDHPLPPIMDLMLLHLLV